MDEIYSKIENDKLLHLIHRISDFTNRSELIDANEFLQISSLELTKDQSFLAHKHIWKQLGSALSIAQESWVVIKGTVEVTFYDIDDSKIASYDLSPGDISVTLYGGHSYRVIEDSLVYEFKTGPYFGQAKDKVFINEIE